MNTKVNVAKAWAEGIGRMKLPEVFIMGGKDGAATSPVENLLNLMTIEKAKNIAPASK